MRPMWYEVYGSIFWGVLAEESIMSTRILEKCSKFVICDQ